MIKIKMLSTGDDVLHGRIIDSNAVWLADYLFQKGMPLCGKYTVGDNLQMLVETLQSASLDADILIVNGGLGTSSDDLSRMAASQALGEELVEHLKWVEHMRNYFDQRGKWMPEEALKQAYLPESAVILANSIGITCGFYIMLNNCQVFFTPGSPNELKMMIEEEIFPRLQNKFGVQEPLIFKNLTTFGCSESKLSAELSSISLHEGVLLGYFSGPTTVDVKLTGPAALKTEIETSWNMIKSKVGKYCLFEGHDGLHYTLKKGLVRRYLNLSISEQFSAGLLYWNMHAVGSPLTTGELCAVEGKSDLLDVVERAKNLIRQNGSDIAIAIGDLVDDSKVSIALVSPQNTYAMTIQHQPQHNTQHLQQEITVMTALDMLRRWLNGWNAYGNYDWPNVVEKL